MNKKKLSVLQIADIVLQFIILVLLLALFYVMSARVTTVEQKQAVLERHMDIIRSDGLNINQ